MRMPRQPLLKLKQSLAFARRTRTPIPLILDIARLRGRPYEAVCDDGTTMRLHPRRGEYFFFYDNVLQRDYLQGGIALNLGDVVFDVGANIGSFTVVAARLVGEAGRVFAFEPNPIAFARLEENVALNRLGNVRCFPFAIGGRAGSFEFFSHDRANFSSLFEGVDRRGLEGMNADTVAVRTLPEVIAELGLESIDLLKLDCEGAEYEIVDHLDAKAAGIIRQLAMETHAVPGRSRRDLIGRLAELGFAPRGRGVPPSAAERGGRVAVLDPHPSRPLPPEGDAHRSTATAGASALP